MSAVSVAPSTPMPTATKVPFGRLVLVEWRKMTDTRAGRTLLIISAGLLLFAMGIVVLVAALNENFTVDLALWSQILVFPLSLLTPVLAILIVTQEWGQRTHMVTFTLEPSRMRVIVAKLVAVVALVLALMAVAVLCGVIGNVLAAALGGYDASWTLDGSMFVWTVISQLLYFVMAFGLAMCLLSTPFSIVVVYTVQLILPIVVWTPLMAFFEWARDLLPFLDIGLATSPFMAQSFMGQSGGLETSDYLALATSILLWVVAPVVLGSMRVIKSELK
ncbi:ABC transporter permease subunit [Nocardioides sp.]|uniref:ABC transporter permease subunit n=1 Tax=Nocardioides sp. TaxID=35761 RepID=UPI001996BFF4|nr:ABC transporter permease subunit [Nocardioides sp.]MBC7276523.1 ABC transporter permease subunit [Nocardioides sp.]